MNKPNLSDFNLSEESLEVLKQKRSRFIIVFVIFSIAVGVANFRFWLWSRTILGNGSIFGLILTYYGVVPGVLSWVLLNKIMGSRYYGGLTRYEKAKKEYDSWFRRTQAAFWDSLSGRQFEHEVAALLTRAGYRAKVTPASGDGGVDVVLADGTIVQCKAHRTSVGPAVARELYGTLRHFKAPKAILISKNGFAKGVYEFARGKPITLWNLNTLIEFQKSLDR